MTKIRVILELDTTGPIPQENAEGIGAVMSQFLKDIIESGRLRLSLDDPRLDARPVTFRHSQVRYEVEDAR